MEKNTQPQRDAAARIQNPTVRAIVLQPHLLVHLLRDFWRPC